MQLKIKFLSFILLFFLSSIGRTESFPVSAFKIKIGPGDSFTIYPVATAQNPVSGPCQSNYPLRNYVMGWFGNPADIAILDMAITAYVSNKMIGINYTTDDSGSPCHVTQIMIQ